MICSRVKYPGRSITVHQNSTPLDLSDESVAAGAAAVFGQNVTHALDTRDEALEAGGASMFFNALRVSTISVAPASAANADWHFARQYSRYSRSCAGLRSRLSAARGDDEFVVRARAADEAEVELDDGDLRVELRELGVADRGGEAQRQRGHDHSLRHLGVAPEAAAAVAAGAGPDDPTIASAAASLTPRSRSATCRACATSPHARPRSCAR